jgi:hypothetical protein
MMQLDESRLSVCYGLCLSHNIVRLLNFHQNDKHQRDGKKKTSMLNKSRKQKTKNKKLQHLEFPRGPPPQYYLGLKELNFANRTGCGAFPLVWPQLRVRHGARTPLHELFLYIYSVNRCSPGQVTGSAVNESG